MDKDFEVSISILPPPTLSDGDEIGYKLYEPKSVKFNFEIDYGFYAKIKNGDDKAQNELRRMMNELCEYVINN